MKIAKEKIIYVYDALCGWCFGFSPVMADFVKEYGSRVDVEVISGGLIMGERVGPIGEVAPYIKTAYKDVERATGVKFGDAFVNGTLEEGTMVSNSLPPAIALAVVKQHKPEKALEYAGLLHQMVYVDGEKPEDIEAYGLYAARIGFNAKEFSATMKKPEYLTLAHEDFQYARSLEANGFPSVYHDTGAKPKLLFSGFLPLGRMKQMVESEIFN